MTDMRTAAGLTIRQGNEECAFLRVIIIIIIIIKALIKVTLSRKNYVAGALSTMSRISTIYIQ